MTQATTCVDCGLPASMRDRCTECHEEVGETPDWWRTVVGGDPQGPVRHGPPGRALLSVPGQRKRRAPSGRSRTARCGHSVSSHGGPARRKCDTCKGRPPRACPTCGSDITRRRPNVKFCTPRCGEVARGERLPTPLPTATCALPTCGGSFRPKYRNQRCCSERHGKLLYNRESRADGRQKPSPWSDRRRDNYHRRRAAKKGASTGRPVRLADIAARDRWHCFCGKRVDAALSWPHPDSASLDHIVPLQPLVGPRGQHDPANVRLAHLRCNTAKGNRGGGEQLMLFG